jgi:hypothetical protein
VTSYTGVQFYAIVNTGETGARLTVGDLYTDPVGGLCTTTPGQPMSCFDHLGARLTITTTWMKYQIPFARRIGGTNRCFRKSTKQPGWAGRR